MAAHYNPSNITRSECGGLQAFFCLRVYTARKQSPRPATVR